MFDIPPAIEIHCDTEVAELVQYVNPRSSGNWEKIGNIKRLIKYSNIVTPCQDAIMNHFFSLIDGEQSDDYMDAIIGEMSSAIILSSVYPKTIELIAPKIPLIKYQNNPNFTHKYFGLLTRLNYPVTDEIRQLPADEGRSFSHSSLWDKNLYLAHNEDEEAINYILFNIKSKTKASTVNAMLNSIQYIKKSVRDRIFNEFKDDTRMMSHPDERFSPSTIADKVERLLEKP